MTCKATLSRPGADLGAVGLAQPPLGKSLAGDADALSDWLSKKAGDLQAFPKRLMGFEPTTFCMASRRSSQLSYSRA